MFQPEVDISNASGDLYKIIDLCIDALRKTGQENHQEKEYEEAIRSMNDKIKDSKADIHTLAILASYCKIL